MSGLLDAATAQALLNGCGLLFVGGGVRVDSSAPTDAPSISSESTSPVGRSRLVIQTTQAFYLFEPMSKQCRPPDSRLHCLAMQPTQLTDARTLG